MTFWLPLKLARHLSKHTHSHTHSLAWPRPFAHRRQRQINWCLCLRRRRCTFRAALPAKSCSTRSRNSAGQRTGSPSPTLPPSLSSSLLLHFLFAPAVCNRLLQPVINSARWLQICLVPRMMRPAAAVACLRAVLISCDLTQPTCRLFLVYSPSPLTPPCLRGRRLVK